LCVPRQETIGTVYRLASKPTHFLLAMCRVCIMWGGQPIRALARAVDGVRYLYKTSTRDPANIREMHAWWDVDKMHAKEMVGNYVREITGGWCVRGEIYESTNKLMARALVFCCYSCCCCCWGYIYCLTASNYSRHQQMPRASPHAPAPTFRMLTTLGWSF
jgi:hypothetical protein